ncbi:hypothetical protein C8J56DRAFT_1160580 [Mycena floridula]|nr:hypothetical protein C8J56DRAFT_1160580 [Mycena floridula]
MSKPIVLVTGGTGFLGAHVISQLLAQKQYTVRATARPGKASKLRAIFPDAGDSLQVSEVESLTADHTTALNGVFAVIHCASPSYLTGDKGPAIFDGAYHGSIHLVEQAISAGIKKIIVTGTFASLVDIDFKAAFGDEPLTAKSWGSVTFESVDLEKDELMAIYQSAKILSEKRIWELAHENPDVDVTVLLPPALFGPFADRFPLPATREGLGTVDFVYSLLTNGSEYAPNPLGHMIDVRDVAKAHVLSLEAPSGKDKRLIISSKSFTWKEAADVVRKNRPELGSRLPRKTAVSPPQSRAPLDTSLAAKTLGLSTYIPWEETILASIDQALIWERQVNL